MLVIPPVAIYVMVTPMTDLLVVRVGKCLGENVAQG